MVGADCRIPAQTDVDRYAEYPKLRDLVAAKDEQVRRYATPPYLLKVRLSTAVVSLVRGALQGAISNTPRAPREHRTSWQGADG